MSIFNYESIGLAASLGLLYTFMPNLRQIASRAKAVKLPKMRLWVFAISMLLWVIYGIGSSAPMLVVLALVGLMFSSILLWWQQL